MQNKIIKIGYGFLAVALFTFPRLSLAAPVYSFNKNCQLAYYHLMGLQFDKGKKLLEEEKTRNPDNLIPYFVENYADFFSLAVNEDAHELVKCQPAKEKRLSKLAQGSKNSPWYLYTQAEVNLQWAFVHLKFEEYYTAFFEIKKAYKQLLENEEKFPGFVANKKSLGLIHALIGTVPDSYKWAVSFLGFNGTISQGIGELNTVSEYSNQNSFLFTRETNYIMAYLQMLILNNPQKSWQIITGPKYPDYKTDLLANFVRGHMAIKNGYTDIAIKTFESAPRTAGYMNFFYIDYLDGLCKMSRLDAGANQPLLKFINEFRGRNYLKDACQKIAWYYLLKQDENNYRFYMALCKNTGASVTDSDKQALDEAENGVLPNTFLIKIRLLQDGGYFDKALGLMAGKTQDDFISLKDRVEFTYRAARLNHEKGDLTNAITLYQSTINIGSQLPNYFAANSALQLGLIYEGNGKTDLAGKYFHDCLAMKNTEYKNSLDQKAKAGLNRLGKV